MINSNSVDSNKQLSQLLVKILKKAVFNSSKNEFYCNYRLGIKQRKLLKDCENYCFTDESGKVWEANFSNRWSEQLPVYFYGQCHTLV